MIATVCIIFLVSSISAWSSPRVIELDSHNFSLSIPSKERSFVMFYGFLCDHCEDFSAIFDEASVITSPDVGFYKISGDGNPEVQNRFKETADYPSIAFFEPYSINTNNIYKGRLELNEFILWVNSTLSDSRLKKTIINPSATNLNPTLCESYMQAMKELEELNQQLDNIKRSIAVLVEENRAANYAVELVQDYVAMNSSWFLELLIFICGLIVGFVIWTNATKEPEKTKSSV